MGGAPNEVPPVGVTPPGGAPNEKGAEGVGAEVGCEKGFPPTGPDPKALVEGVEAAPSLF